jgi:hypothetical protein
LDKLLRAKSLSGAVSLRSFRKKSHLIGADPDEALERRHVLFNIADKNLAAEHVTDGRQGD